MNIKLSSNNYLIIPNFINSFRAKELADEFKIYSESNNMGGDTQAPNSQSDYNYISLLELLCEKTHQVSSILEETVLPTYVYSRVYYKDSILNRHKDRDACEISLTLHLDGDKPWPIWIQTPEGVEKSVLLEAGDAMMYLGRIAEHWREKYEGEYYTQAFLHYVRSRGDCAYAYFDKVKSECKDNDSSPKNTNDEIITDNMEDEKKKNNSIEIIVPRPTNTLEEYIHVFDDIITNDLCDEILEEYLNSDEWIDAQIGNENVPVNKMIRNCRLIDLSTSNVISKNYDKRKKIDESIYQETRKAIELYANYHQNFKIDVDTGYQLLQYNEGNFYIEHTDSFQKQQRSVSCSLHLNDDYEGGNFGFFDRQMQVRAGKGAAVMFPSNFMFPHEIMPITKGTRYSIITWLV